MNISAVEACIQDLFTDAAELADKYPRDIVDKIIRVRDLYVAFLREPSITDAALVKLDAQHWRVSRPTAYSDLAALKSVLPALGREAREFHKLRAKEMLLETYRIAKAKMDVRTMERVSASYARAFNIDREDAESVPVEQILVQPWIPTDDPSVIGLTPLPDRAAKVKKLLEEFSATDPDIMDVDFEEADLEEDRLFPDQQQPQQP